MNADFTGMFQVLDLLKRVGNMAQSQRERAVMAAALAYEADMKQVAPVDTGHYRSSITSKLLHGGVDPIAVVGSPLPYTRRLEYGYVGVDSMGRFYNQRPKPHWRPTWDFGKVKYELILSLTLAGKL